MKKTFTILIATLMLLTMTSQPTRLWGQTATQTSFTATSGNVNSNSIVSYTAHQGSASTAPGVYDNAIRLYQASSSSNTGGYVVIGVSNGYKITSATIQSTMATTTGYKLTDTDPGNDTPAKNTFNVSNYSLSTNTDYEVSNIETQYIVFACFGTTKSTRLYLSKISITYQSTGGGTQTVTITGDGISNNAISFAYNNTSNHTATVTCSNFASTPTPTIGVYTDAECNTTYDGSDFIAAFAQNSITIVNYAFANANSTSSPRTFYMRATANNAVNSNIVAVSQAAAPTLYTVNFALDGGTFVPNATFTTNPMSLEAGDYTLPSATKDGYLFVSWKDGNNNNEYYAGASYTLSGNVTLTAQWEELDYDNTYTSDVTLSTTGGTNASDCKVKIYNVEYDGIKAGVSGNAGAWQVTVPANTTKLHLHLAGWNGENVTLSVAPSGYPTAIALTANSGISGSGSTYTFSGDPSTDSYYKIITFADPLEEAVTLTFTATGGNRFVVWGVNAEMSTDPYITAEDVDIDDDVTAGSITYTVHNIPEPAGVLSASVKTGDWLTLGSVSSNVPFTCAVNPNPTERTATVTLTYTYGDSKTTTLDVTVTQAPKVVTYTYTLATSIESGKHYIITDGGTKIMGSQSGNNRTAVDISEEGYYDNVNNKYSIPSNADGIREFVINGPNVITKGNNIIEVYTIYDAAQPGYLYCSSSDSKSYLRSRTFSGQTDNLEKWTITFSEGASVITSVGRNDRNIIQLNSTLFNCYTSGYDNIYLYVKNEVTPQYDFYKDIAAHTDATGAGNTDGWYFIASPVNSNNMTPASVTNMIAETAANYDLYRLSGNTLQNYKNENTHDFVIANGVGYLYSNAANTTLKFSGSSVKTYSTSDNTVIPSHPVWNLIGNPYTFPVRVSRAFSELDNGSAVNSKDANSIINPGAGVIVYGMEEVTFTKYEPTDQSSGPSNINIMLAQQVASRDGSSTTSVAIDNAVVSFNSNSRLPKFTLLEGNAKLYIPQNGEDYAIAFSNRQGDMPLNFKTTETGNYTISFEGNNMNLRGIYLIDMLAGQEIDLSVNPSYTFIGSPVDKAERFKIVFKNVGSNGEDIFAYQNGNDIIVSGEGELQIFDVTGRSVMTTTISGVETINVPTMGVYIFRLIGSEIKTQKIVVR